MDEQKYNEFQMELTELLIKHKIGEFTETPAPALAAFLRRCLWAWTIGIGLRELGEEK